MVTSTWWSLISIPFSLKSELCSRQLLKMRFMLSQTSLQLMDLHTISALIMVHHSPASRFETSFVRLAPTTFSISSPYHPAPTSWKWKMDVSFNAPGNISERRTNHLHQSVRLPTSLFVLPRFRNNRSPNHCKETNESIVHLRDTQSATSTKLNKN